MRPTTCGGEGSDASEERRITGLLLLPASCASPFTRPVRVRFITTSKQVAVVTVCCSAVSRAEWQHLEHQQHCKNREQQRQQCHGVQRLDCCCCSIAVNSVSTACATTTATPFAHCSCTALCVSSGSGGSWDKCTAGRSSGTDNTLVHIAVATLHWYMHTICQHIHVSFCIRWHLHLHMHNNSAFMCLLLHSHVQPSHML